MPPRPAFPFAPSTRSPGRAGTRVLAVAVLAMLAVGFAAATARASWMVPPRPWRAKDFALLKRDGLYHIFYTRTNTNDPNGYTENALGHAVSWDLHVWTQRDTVLPIRPGAWDNHRVWAPHVIEVGGAHYLFYTGVTEIPGSYRFHQRTGLAVSTDLETWNRFDQPVFDCTRIPWSLCDPLLPIGGNLRDPFVMPDPSLPGRWLMYQTAVPASDPDRSVVEVATSSGPFTSWNDLKPLWVTHHSTTGRELAESPHLFFRGSQWYLMFSTNGPQPISWATGTDAVGEPPAWNYRGTLSTMLGLNTQYWFASEHMRDGTIDYLAFVNFDRVDIRKMVWKPDGTFSLVQPDYFHVTSLSWSRDSVEVGGAATLRLRSVHPAGQWVDLGVIEVDADGANEYLVASALGLPDRVQVTDTLMTIPWVARGWTDGDDVDSTTAEIVVHVGDATARSPVMVVTPIGGCSGSGDPGELIDPALVAEAFPRLRALHRTPLDEGPAVLVEMEVAGPGRLEVYDVQGRRLGTLVARDFPGGASVVPWAGAGTRLPGAPGVRFIRLVTPHGDRWTRIVVTR